MTDVNHISALIDNNELSKAETFIDDLLTRNGFADELEKLTILILKNRILRKTSMYQDGIDLLEKYKPQDFPSGEIFIEYKFELSANYYRLGEVSTSMEYVEEIEKFMDGRRKYDKYLPKLLNHLGRIYLDQGKYDKAISSFSKGLEKVGSDDITKAMLLNGIGIVYFFRGNYPKCINYYEKALELNQKIGEKQQLGTVYSNIGYTHYVNGDQDLSISNLKKSYNINKSLGNHYLIATSLFNMIRTYIARKEVDEAKSCLEELSEIHENHSHISRIADCYNLSNALLLLQNKRLRDKIKAEEILRDIIDKNEEYQFTIIAIFHLIELLIFEYKTYGEELVFDEIMELTNRIHRMAQDLRLYPTLLDVVILKARMSVVENKFDLANTYLTQGLIMAKEQNMDEYQSKIRVEIKSIEDNINELRNIVESSSISDNLEKMEILEYINRVQTSRQDRTEPINH